MRVMNPMMIGTGFFIVLNVVKRFVKHVCMDGQLVNPVLVARPESF